MAPAESPEGETVSGKRRLSDCAAQYVTEIAAHRSVKTTAAYRYAVWSFLVFAGFDVFVGPRTRQRRLDWIEAVQREDILGWVEELRAKGDSPRTVRDRVDHFQIFLHHWQVGLIVKRSDLSKFIKTKVPAYNPQEMAKLYEHALAVKPVLRTLPVLPPDGRAPRSAGPQSSSRHPRRT